MLSPETQALHGDFIPLLFFRVFQMFSGGIQAKVQGNLVLKLIISFEMFHIPYAFNTENRIINRLTCRVSFQTNCETYYKMLYLIFHKGLHVIHKIALSILLLVNSLFLRLETRPL